MIAAAASTGAKMSQPGGPRRLVLWFRNDLRLHDNPMVSSALQKLKAKEVDDVSPRLTQHPTAKANNAAQPACTPDTLHTTCARHALQLSQSQLLGSLCSSKRPTSAGACAAITFGSRSVRYLVLHRWCLCTAWMHASSRPRPGATSRRAPTGGHPLQQLLLDTPFSCLSVVLGRVQHGVCFINGRGASRQQADDSGQSLNMPLLCVPALALPRAKFLLESAQDLKQSLKALGSDLLVTVGLPEEVIAGVEVLAGRSAHHAFGVSESTRQYQAVQTS